MNKISRYHIAIEALAKASINNPEVTLDSHLLTSEYQKQIKENSEYIIKYGVDPDHLSANIGDFRVSILIK